jgi:5-methylcytosine-specific restriction endonuclease McrA
MNGIGSNYLMALAQATLLACPFNLYFSANQRRINMKTCTECHTSKDESCFTKTKRNISGLGAKCKTCKKVYHKEYYKNNKDKLDVISKEYYVKNKDAISAHSKVFNKLHKEEIAKNKRIYYLENRDTFLENRRIYRSNNRQSINKKQSEYFKTPLGRATHSVSRNRRRSRSKNTKKDQQKIKVWLKKVYRKKKFKCYYCEKSFPKKMLHIDHIVPLAKEGKNIVENLCTSCCSCNLSKNAKSVKEFSENSMAQMLLII